MQDHSSSCLLGSPMLSQVTGFHPFKAEQCSTVNTYAMFSLSGHPLIHTQVALISRPLRTMLKQTRVCGYLSDTLASFGVVIHRHRAVSGLGTVCLHV